MTNKADVEPKSEKIEKSEAKVEKTEKPETKKIEKPEVKIDVAHAAFVASCKAIFDEMAELEIKIVKADAEQADIEDTHRLASEKAGHMHQRFAQLQIELHDLVDVKINPCT